MLPSNSLNLSGVFEDKKTSLLMNSSVWTTWEINGMK